ncbi:hypothetical protein HYDPIDRAFT_92519 [Hydnomerulius pinastri MD-312]|uniref:Kinase n=1 Tax=Hydnomerulius pinastri MD-312 TaxID=994086 RepID=A0A0C9VYH7_9AGAM|nr:hypothetical protein HYDPIDRAFT_92519 [Hydnomerulius pinastri MD-312]
MSSLPPQRPPKRSRTLSPTTALSQQVGGHKGVQTTEDNTLLLKPALPREVAFYQLVRDTTDTSTNLHLLREWIPKFLGVLNLEGRIADPSVDVEAGAIPTIIPTTDRNGTHGPSQTLVLENLIHGYCKPCILDVKLGTVLYDEDATEEKKARMIKTANETTSFETGIRLTGFQVYTNDSSEPTVYPKSYGKSIKAVQLYEGIEKFFPDDVLPSQTLLHLLDAAHASLQGLHTALNQAHLRMVGGSVLIIYEADKDRAAAALEHEVPPRLYTVSLIDFAHTRVVPGQGPDKGVLKGLDTLIGLVERRKKAVEAIMKMDSQA